MALASIIVLSHFTVESCKKSLTKDSEVASSVDWLTEVIRRFSDAALAARPFTSVNMKSGMRLEKVCHRATAFLAQKS